MHEVRFDEQVISFLERLPKHVQSRVMNKIFEAKRNPEHYFERLAHIPYTKGESVISGRKLNKE